MNLFKLTSVIHINDIRDKPRFEKILHQEKRIIKVLFN